MQLMEHFAESVCTHARTHRKFIRLLQYSLQENTISTVSHVSSTSIVGPIRCSVSAPSEVVRPVACTVWMQADGKINQSRLPNILSSVRLSKGAKTQTNVQKS